MESNGNRNVAFYARVSTNKEQTTENQTIRFIEYAKAKGWTYDIFEEVMSTRKTRPVKQELMQRLRNGEYHSVVVFKLDRFARSSTELVLDVKEITDKGIAFISLSDNLDFGTASGKLHFQILAAFAEFERELIRERTIEGLHRAKLQGKKAGRPKGTKDSKPRKKSGYIIMQANKRKKADEVVGVIKPLASYID